MPSIKMRCARNIFRQIPIAATLPNKAEGKIRNIGVFSFDAKQMQRALEVAAIASLQPEYSLLATDVEESVLTGASHYGRWRRNRHAGK